MKNIIKILYGVLAIAIGICFFCMVMLRKNNSKEMEDVVFVEQMTDLFVQDKEETSTEPFDHFLTGTGEMKSVDITIDGIPCMLYYMNNYEKHPILILQHGMTSKKEDMQPLSIAFAEKGFLVVTPDAVAHGELKDDKEWTVPEMIQKTSANFDCILNYFAQSNYVNMEKIAMSGISLGGLSVLHYSANGSYNPTVIATMCATPKYEDLMMSQVATSYVKKGKTIAEGDEEKLAVLDDMYTQMSPYETILMDTNTCYYLMCGEQDDVVPCGGNVSLYDAMKDKAQDITLKVKQGQGHTVTEEDLWEVLSYVVAHI